jgi:FO synthase
MADWPEPPLAEHLWTIAIARIILGPAMNIQAPPNLQPGALEQLADAGINDWGGVSPVTPDHVNPEAPWPHLHDLEAATERAGRRLVERTALYPSYLAEGTRWVDPKVLPIALRHVDGAGYAREHAWSPGVTGAVPKMPDLSHAPTPPVRAVLEKSAAGELLSEADLVTLFSARGSDYAAVCATADDRRRHRNGDTVTYVVNRNINYTNVCTYGCKFCAFSKGRHSAQLRGPAYDLDLSEVARRAEEAWARGGTEVCMQGGIHPRYTGQTYVSLLRAVKDRVPDMHVHAFSPLEVSQGAMTLQLTVREYLSELKAAGLGSLPGTAAEILDDEVRQVICPDKLSTDEWLDIVGTAHEVGLRTTATIMYGHVDGYAHWARHLIRIRDLQRRTGGFTEFVPLPFVHMEAPMYLRGKARNGPSFREAILMHAVARLALDPFITSIQGSWVKLGPQGMAVALQAGVNDLGGTLMNESISRAAGTEHGQEFAPAAMEALAASIGRTAQQRTTLYGAPPAERITASFAAARLEDCVFTPVGRVESAPETSLKRMHLQ